VGRGKGEDHGMGSRCGGEVGRVAAGSAETLALAAAGEGNSRARVATTPWHRDVRERLG